MEQYPTEQLEVTIDHINYKGQGYARYIHAPDRGSQGRHLHLNIPFTVPGDVVQVTVENAKGRHKATVHYDKIIHPSPMRDTTIPMDEAICAGTPLVYMKYADQLEYKLNMVQNALAENDFDPALVKPVLGMDNPNRYRNKMELTFGSEGELGMHQQGNYRRVIDMKDSYIATEAMVEIKHIVSQWRRDFNLPGYVKDTHTGLLRNLLMRQSFSTGEMMVVLYATEGPDAYAEAADELTRRLLEAQPKIHSLQWVVHQDIADRIQSDEVHILHGRDFIYDELSGFKYRIWPNTFFQANPVQAEQMVKIALEMAQVDSNLRVLDLYCGVGTFSLPLARAAKDLCGIEIVDTSIQSARRNAQDNGLTNTHFITSDARSALKTLKDTWGQPDLLLLNPPRSGAGGKVMRSIGCFGTDKIIYVSCNPNTLAEDMRWLRDFGYQLQEAQPVDQFPHTHHVETVVLMQKVKE